MSIKFGEAEMPTLQASEDDGGDQKAGNYKENVDTNKATLQSEGKCMKDDNRQDCYCTQAINIWAIGEMCIVVFRLHKGWIDHAAGKTRDFT